MNILTIKQQLFEIVLAVLAEQFSESETIATHWSVDQLFSIPENPDFGFLSTNIALQLNSVLDSTKKRSPRDHAEHLLPLIETRIRATTPLESYIESITIAGPGFINFLATPALYQDGLQAVLENPKNWGHLDLYQGQHMLVEFTDPNPFKEFHIGHLMSNCIGESIARLYEAAGASVSRLCYQGDVGMHVAKTIWAWQQDIQAGKNDLETVKMQPLPQKVQLLGSWYARGAQAYSEGTEAEKEAIKEVNRLVFSREDEAITTLYDQGRQWSLEAFDLIYDRLGTTFEKHYFESNTGKVGEQIVRDNLGDVFIESQGAIIYPGEKFGLHNRVFINSQGLPTYEAKELGLAVTKDADFEYDLSIIITGNEINDYFAVLLSALEKIAPQAQAKTRHIGHGMLRLPQGKMSSRTGNVITGTDLIQIVTDKIKELSPDKPDQLYDTLAVSALKFSLLKQNIGRDVVFDINESTALTGATGVYLQYTHARATSLLKKSELDLQQISTAQLSASPATQPVIRELFYFPSIVEQAATHRSPNLIAGYLLNLAQLYNSYYAENRIIGTEQEATGVLVSSLTQVTLANGLEMLGIRPVEEM